ncbi:hypothetical protein GYMLUDRAFT_42342 [Collybiopsis luxurians FD-317 M1]|uniref:DUF6533 domain-containing protein n=1 Tax=Collybiopsis luxurians FD-317 M1 TaxID=944289 RepID=A0A0D0CZF1_9AGAR|nr:hypothetical protein GYMLUDRAFT_42342 [Collybiopsis luxurians FD-317 M1]
MGSQNFAPTTHYLQFDVTWASIALIYYDWLLTFPEEVKYIWRAKFSLSTLFYIFCRYALLANVLYLLEISNVLGPSTSATCDGWRRFVSALAVFGRAAVIATLIGRAYAVCSRNRLILAYLTALGAMCVIADVLHVPSEKCADTSDPPLAYLLRSLFTMAFETSVAVITTIRTFQALRVGGPWKRQKYRLVYLVFEEGILYFCTISFLTIASVILDLRAPTGFLQQFLDGLTLPLSGALTARFILHLRAWHGKHSGVHIISTFQQPEEGHQGDRFLPQNDSNIVDSEATLVRPPPAMNEFGEDPVVRAQHNSVPGIILVQVDSEVHYEDVGSLDGRSSNTGDFHSNESETVYMFDPVCM